MRTVILLVAVVFITTFAGLTIAEIAKHGVDPLSVGSVLVVTLMGVGIVGALRHPPDS